GRAAGPSAGAGLEQRPRRQERRRPPRRVHPLGPVSWILVDGHGDPGGVRQGGGGADTGLVSATTTTQPVVVWASRAPPKIQETGPSRGCLPSMRAAVPLVVTSVLPVLILSRLFIRQNSIVFRPSAPLDRTPADCGVRYDEVRLSGSDGSRLRAWWLPAEQSEQVVVYFHGSDGNLTLELPVVRFLAALGVNALLVE